jgi:ubiquinone/menaquinone biosynthesis C-methylase UbiE
VASKALSFLDVAGGTGDVAEQVARSSLEDGIVVRATVLDRAISHMNGRNSGVSKVVGDATALPLETTSFDVVGCNLFCHHLEPDQMITFFNEALRVSRLGVIVSDLRRNLFHWLAAYAGKPIYRTRLTRNDAPASVRRAYTIQEITHIASCTSASGFDVRPYYFQRFGLILWKAKP